MEQIRSERMYAAVKQTGRRKVCRGIARRYDSRHVIEKVGRGRQVGEQVGLDTA